MRERERDKGVVRGLGGLGGVKGGVERVVKGSRSKGFWYVWVVLGFGAVILMWGLWVLYRGCIRWFKGLGAYIKITCMQFCSPKRICNM